ncbi:MAG: flippase-like domain-containing protein [Actinobacteria bacterium]|nr:flippase-like domain-containing protein [Actinomycetota bacterium]
MRSRGTTLAWRLVRFLVAGVLLAWLVSWADVSGLATADLGLGWLALALCLVPLSIAVRAWNLGLVLNRERRVLSAWGLYRLTLVGAGLALFLPAGAADLAKARWGLVAHGSSEEMVVSAIVDKLTALLAVGLLGLIAALIAGDAVLAGVAGVVSLASLIPLFVRWDAAWRVLVKLLAGKREIDVDRVAHHARPPVILVAKLTGVSTIAWFVTYAVVYACVMAVDAPVSLATVMGIAPLVTISRLIPISAGGLGLGEVTMTALLVRAGVPETIAAQAAIMQLILLVLLPGVVGLIFLGMGTRAAGAQERSGT